MRTRGAQVIGVVLLLCACGSTAAAQTTAVTGRWEVEFRGGLAAGTTPSGGDLTLPLPGPVLAGTNPQFPTRQSPTWFLGDGASQLNGAIADLGLPSRLSSLDAALGAAGLDASNRATFGVSARRGIAPQYSIEFSLDILTGATRLSDDVRDAVAAARESFAPAFTGLLGSGPFTGLDVDATSALDDVSGRELALTAAFVWHAQTSGAFVPYLTMGGGLLTGLGSLPSATLEGHYRFAIFGTDPVDETDRLTVRFERATTPVGLVGGGIERALSGGWAFRIDGRALLGPSSARTIIDAAPTSVRGTPAGFIELFTNPGLQFSNDPATGRQSTLSGDGLSGFEVFAGDGLQTRWLVTVGVVRKF